MVFRILIQIDTPWNKSRASALLELRANRKLLLAILAGFTFFQPLYFLPAHVSGRIPLSSGAGYADRMDVQFHGTFRRVRFLFLILKMHPETDMRKIMNAADQPHNNQLNRTLETIGQGAIAGAAGGLAEIAWVTLYAAATGANPAALARGVTTAAGMNALFPADPIALGVTVHMGIAVTLGIALAFVWQALSSRHMQTISPFPFTVAALAAVWAINFFVVLPIVSPAFIQLVPYSVSLISKLLFGLAAAGVFRQLATPALNMERARIAPRLP